MNLLTDEEFIRPSVYDEIGSLVGNASTPVLIFAASSTVANAMKRSMNLHNVKSDIVTGAMPKPTKERIIESFRNGELDVLVGTATMATGTDGLDKMCDTLIILQDTDDASLRRQLIGRIMPRGEDVDASNKTVWRVVF